MYLNITPPGLNSFFSFYTGYSKRLKSTLLFNLEVKDGDFMAFPRGLVCSERNGIKRILNSARRFHYPHRKKLLT